LPRLRDYQASEQAAREVRSGLPTRRRQANLSSTPRL
jgi:hypothetical protein